MVQAQVQNGGANGNAAYRAALQRSVERHGPDLGRSPYVQEFRAFQASKAPESVAKANNYEKAMENIEKNPHPHSDAFMDYVGATLAHGMKAAQPLTEGLQ